MTEARGGQPGRTRAGPCPSGRWACPPRGRRRWLAHPAIAPRDPGADQHRSRSRRAIPPGTRRFPPRPTTSRVKMPDKRFMYKDRRPCSSSLTLFQHGWAMLEMRVEEPGRRPPTGCPGQPRARRGRLFGLRGDGTRSLSLPVNLPPVPVSGGSFCSRETRETTGRSAVYSPLGADGRRSLDRAWVGTYGFTRGKLTGNGLGDVVIVPANRRRTGGTNPRPQAGFSLPSTVTAPGERRILPAGTTANPRSPTPRRNHQAGGFTFREKLPAKSCVGPALTAPASLSFRCRRSSRRARQPSSSC